MDTLVWYSIQMGSLQRTAARPTWRTSASTPWTAPGTWPCQSCTAGRSPARAGRLGLGRTVGNRWRAAPGMQGVTVRRACNYQFSIFKGSHCKITALHLGHGEGGRPLGAKDVQADAAVAVDVRVIDLRGERNLTHIIFFFREMHDLVSQKLQSELELELTSS